MNKGTVYAWTPISVHHLGGRVELATVSLPHLEPGAGSLCGRFATVHNAAVINEPGRTPNEILSCPLGDASPDRFGDYLFNPGNGGGRLDKVEVAPEDMRFRYIQASRFGEVNTYFHLTLISSYIDDLLEELGIASLPSIVARVNAHHGVPLRGRSRDGIQRGDRWTAFQGGHYRLPSARSRPQESETLTLTGEIHLGPGQHLSSFGALAELWGSRYRANASHNAGILYHEYGHHITRHTADLQANNHRAQDRQSNRKTALDEGTCDYWAATMLNTPHIWAWHQRHDAESMHPRSLSSSVSMMDFDSCSTADPHVNGTIWGAALWDLRNVLCEHDAACARHSDLLVLCALHILGTIDSTVTRGKISTVCHQRNEYPTALSALLQADQQLHAGRYCTLIHQVFARRGIYASELLHTVEGPPRQRVASPSTAGGPHVDPDAPQPWCRHVSEDDIPPSTELLGADTLASTLASYPDLNLSLIAVGDIMLGGRSRNKIKMYGDDYPLAAAVPLLRSAPIVLGNLEGPFANHARRQERHFSYRVHPSLAKALVTAGINVVTVANNHLVDCGRAGVLETLEALDSAGISIIGGGRNEAGAHQPAILQSGPMRIGLLGYYWNQRCAAGPNEPGSATDAPEELEADITRLRPLVNRLVVTFHWGVPYNRAVTDEEFARARFAVECGADAVIGHHTHVIQRFTVYREAPIFFGLGNCAFGSGNSKAEGLILGLRFEAHRTVGHLFPLYVKNRDPRINYQPKLMTGAASRRVLRLLCELSEEDGPDLELHNDWGTLTIPRTVRNSQCGLARDA